jgi:hypothetical protein
LAFGAAASASAQSRDQFFFSDDASMTAGAVTATSDDSGSIYYNPAGLSLNRRSTADLSASTFGLRIRPVDGAMATNFPNGRSSLKLDSFDIISAPHAIAFTRQLGEDSSLGLALYIVDFDVRTGNATAADGLDPATGERLRQHVDIDFHSTKYVFGPALGWQLAPGVRFGFGVYGTYAKRVASGRLFFDGTSPAQPDGSVPVSFLTANNRAELSFLGVRGMAGVQWDMAPEWRLGVAARTPELQLTAGGSSLATTAFADGSPGATARPFFNVTELQPDSSVGLTMPPQLVASVARNLGEKSFVSAEVDLQTPLRVVSLGVDRDTTINARIGGIARVSERVSLGAGFFTDRATRSVLTPTIGDDRVDYYGITIGGQLRTLLPLADRAGEPLVLTTTVSLRAAVGVGEARAYDLDLTRGLVARTSDVTYYEFVPYLGSGITF